MRPMTGARGEIDPRENERGSEIAVGDRFEDTTRVACS